MTQVFGTHSSAPTAPARPPNGSRRGDVAGARSRVLPRGRHALDRWQVRKEFQKIARAARLGGEWTPSELRHSFVAILSAHDVRLEDIGNLVGHSSTSFTETVYPSRDPVRSHR